MSNLFSEINNNNVKTINNNGTDGIHDHSNQCMLISILDYLRHISHQVPENTTIDTFRRNENINNSNWEQHTEFNYENTSQMNILRRIADKYDLTLNIKYLNRNRGIEYIGNVAYTIGRGRQNINILAFGNHFQLIIDDESPLFNNAVAQRKLSRHYKAHYFNETTNTYENIDDINNKNDKYTSELKIYSSLIKDLQSRLKNYDEKNIEKQINNEYIKMNSLWDQESKDNSQVIINSLINIQDQFEILNKYIKEYNELAKKIDENIFNSEISSTRPTTPSTKPTKPSTYTTSTIPIVYTKSTASTKPTKSNDTTRIIEQIQNLNKKLTNINNEIRNPKIHENKAYLERRKKEIEEEINRLEILLNSSFEQKYLKYKQKYLKLKNKI